ncbi:hypothetical protein M1L60_40520 [Actinoplanes sp. TRM 88003]|uniref:Uncharacterized protein n=1 Tax=Paractinoplanes aksuensis TaxID=2939490 RepID=A0ABT1E186_9ACTN|nr:hypothetical protein [Actinoplanes aksuensis]MCO8276884.1 hypothetical protein [Actinoplanes aksuensis]
MRYRRLLQSLPSGDDLLRLTAVTLSALILGRALLSGSSGWWAFAYVVAGAAGLWGALWIINEARKAMSPPKSADDLEDKAANAVKVAKAAQEAAAAATKAAKAARAEAEAKAEALAKVVDEIKDEAEPDDATKARAATLKSRVLGMLTAGNRPGLVVVLALLVLVVHAAITGYVGVGTILVAILLAVVAVLLTADFKLVALLGGIAAVFALATVMIADIFAGSTEARALGISVAAIVLPVVISDKLSGLVRDKGLRPAHHAVLAVLTLALSFLGYTRDDWLPGVLNNCYTLPTSSGITTLKATEDGRCYGLIDSADGGVFAASAFGKDPVTVALQRRILDANEPLKPGHLTVVWLGALSCEPLKADPARCADGRDYPSERDQLRAFLYAQSHIAATTKHKVHMVIADAGPDVAHIDDVAAMIVEREKALGDRVVVIGGGDSRDVTQSAINRLLKAGIPFIAPNLLADLGAPSKKFVDKPGYLQLAPSNTAYADDTARRLTQAYRKEGGFRLDIYQQPSPTDQYTTSLVNDLLAAVASKPGSSARHVPALDKIDDSICESDKGRPPAVLYFADRWTRFAEFVQRVNEVCGHSRPRLVVADVSVSRFMANYQLRAASTADWAVNYNVGGPGCADLSQPTYEILVREIEKQGDLVRLKGPFGCADRRDGISDGQLLDACPLDAAAKLTSQQCDANDLGTYLIPAWDAVLLADALLKPRPVDDNDLTKLNLPDFTLATGKKATVVRGDLHSPTIDVRMWHGMPLNNPRIIWELPTAPLRLPDDPEPGRPAVTPLD